MKAIEVAEEIGAKNVIGQAWYDLGFLYRSKGQVNKGRECLLKSMEVFEKCKAVSFLKRTKESLERFR